MCSLGRNDLQCVVCGAEVVLDLRLSNYAIYIALNRSPVRELFLVLIDLILVLHR